MRYRPTWHFWLLIAWVVAFVVLGYFGTQTTVAGRAVHLDDRHGHLFRVLCVDAVVEPDGIVQAGSGSCDLQTALRAPGKE